MELLKAAMEKLKQSHPEFSQAPNVLGIQSMSSSEYVIRIAAECSPSKRTEVERLIQTFAKEALEDAEMGRGTAVSR